MNNGTVNGEILYFCFRKFYKQLFGDTSTALTWGPVLLDQEQKREKLYGKS